MRRAILFPLLIGAPLLLFGCGEARSGGSPQPDEVTRVKCAQPARRDVTRKLQIAASLAPWEEVVLYAKASGYLRAIRVDRGDRVTKGQLLAILDIPEARLEVARYAAEAQEATAAADKARADLKLAETTAGRLDKIHAQEPGAVSQQQLDEARGKVESVRATVVRQEKRAAALDAAGRREKAIAGYGRVVAPFDGVVTERNVDPGALVVAGTSGKATPIVKVVNSSRLRVIVDVPESDVPHVVVGSAARLSVDAFPESSFTGTVARRAEALDPASRTMRVEIEVDNSDGRLFAGMFGRIVLDLDTRQNVLTIDPQWMRLQKDRPYVMVASEGMAKKVLFETGADDGNAIEVVSGLDDDAQVIVGFHTLSDGDKVEIVGTNKSAPTGEAP